MFHFAAQRAAFLIRSAGRLRLSPSALPIKLLGEAVKSSNAAAAKRKSAKKLCFESGFSFLSDFPAVNAVNRKICSPKK